MDTHKNISTVLFMLGEDAEAIGYTLPGGCTDKMQWLNSKGQFMVIRK